MKKIYLDNSTTTRPSDRAISKMFPYLTDYWGVSTAPHQKGQEVFPEIEESFRKIYALVGAPEEDCFIFTSSGPEAVNHVFFSVYLEVTREKGKNQYIASAVDEAAGLMSVSRLERMGCVGKMVGVTPSGLVSEELLADAITPRTALVSLPWANGLTGVINPVQHLSQICKDRGVLFHLDATHVLGKIFYQIEDIGADFITFNGDHLHAPKGTGGLFIKKGVKSSPFIVGGLDQGGLRAGHLNVAALAALGAAAEELLESREFVCTETARLRGKLEQRILEGFPDGKVLFEDAERLPNVTVFAFPGVVNEALLFLLNREHVYASIGGGSFQQLKLILEASGIPEKISQTAVSFSLSKETTEDDVEKAAEIIVKCVKKCYKTSTRLLS